MQWVKGLEQSGLLSLLFKPYFVQSTKVTNYVRQLLVIFHGGFLWLDKLYSVDVGLISIIIGLPRVGLDPVSVLDKDKDSALIVKFKDKYDMARSSRGFSISSINDPNIRMT